MLLGLIVALSVLVYLINVWNTPPLKDMVDENLAKHQQEIPQPPTGELTQHIASAIEAIEEVPLPTTPKKRRSKNKRK